jgi:hypothetical protein
MGDVALLTPRAHHAVGSRTARGQNRSLLMTRTEPGSLLASSLPCSSVASQVSASRSMGGSRWRPPCWGLTLLPTLHRLKLKAAGEAPVLVRGFTWPGWNLQLRRWQVHCHPPPPVRQRKRPSLQLSHLLQASSRPWEESGLTQPRRHSGIRRPRASGRAYSFSRSPSPCIPQLI